MNHKSDSEIDDKDYRESEDEDFNPDTVALNDSEGDSDDDEDKSEPIPSYASIEGSGLVKTRSQRLKEEPEVVNRVKGETTVDVNALWAEMNTPTQSAGTPTTDKPEADPKPELKQESVEITRTFKFAGKVTTETKTVLKSSAEGRAYLQEQKADPTSTPSSGSNSSSTPPPKKRLGPAKRKLTLQQEYEAGKAKKINTLQKSQLDWLNFVDKEGIQDDLKKHNKDGYLEKQGFLARVEHNVDQDIRSHHQAQNQRRL
ncbi:SWR1-complex protein 5 [Wickerhamiella sorbophila]|uniref:SWR1-complex protein 5 n=1 Tax=Wickerhamiella sorbophila TaxID=45607 RepID=A0A2T0FC19_9ASCO|nr:SWR1-complex protein 5 [Wickerhamiella sorbophila]PRT52552.1 SWR1-complex protein 5 [Wickerhamiella sorbophila]